MPFVKDFTSCLEGFAPLSFQESYDNSGMQVGSLDSDVAGVLLAIDVTEDVVDEAVSLGCNLIIVHHPLIFGGLKRLLGNNMVERVVIKAIKNNISIYACHTNIDNAWNGVSFKMAEKLNLSNLKVLRPLSGALCKLVIFVPENHAEAVRNAIFEAGAGCIGNYDSCSFNSSGTGTFRALDGASPFVGEVGSVHKENEVRVETVFPRNMERQVLKALTEAHPYEEVAYDIYAIDNLNTRAGAGVIGELGEPEGLHVFLKQLKDTFNVPLIRYTPLDRPIKRVALCGGSGSTFLKDAQREGADIFISGDFKYHQFFEAENKIVIADIGHFESEQFTLEIFYDILVKKYPNFAIRFTKVKTNPINYC
jgi:dinuclear metal center YbgI/SA1388 family protein